MNDQKTTRKPKTAWLIENRGVLLCYARLGASRRWVTFTDPDAWRFDTCAEAERAIAEYGLAALAFAMKHEWVSPPRRVPEHTLKQLRPKPRTTVKRFAADLKDRIERASFAFDQPGQSERVDGMRYVLGIVDAALSDYDVRDPGDPITPPPRRVPEEKAEPMTPQEARADALGYEPCEEELQEYVTAVICGRPKGHTGLHEEYYEVRESQWRSQLDASRAENAELQRERDEALEALRDSHMRTPIWDKLEALAESALDVDKRIESATVTSLRVANAELRRALESAAEALDVAARGAPLSAAKLAAEMARAALRAAEKAPEAREPDPPTSTLVSADAAGLHLSPLARDGLNLPPADPEEPTPPTHPFAANCPCGSCRATQDAAVEVVAREAVRQLSAPPAAEGLTAEEWASVAAVLEWQTNANGIVSIHAEETACRLLPRVRAAAEKAGGR